MKNSPASFQVAHLFIDAWATSSPFTLTPFSSLGGTDVSFSLMLQGKPLFKVFYKSKLLLGLRNQVGKEKLKQLQGVYPLARTIGKGKTMLTFPPP